MLHLQKESHETVFFIKVPTAKIPVHKAPILSWSDKGIQGQ